jgi:alkaline phosphatase D
VLKGLAGTAASASLRGYAGESGPVTFSHGVASGDPLHDRVILWTRALACSGSVEAIPVGWEISRDAAFSKIVASAHTFSSAARDWTVKVDASGLEPATQYFYRFRSGASVSPTGVTKTLPVGSTASVTLAVVSCANLPRGFFHAYRALAERADLDAVLHLGDYIYEYPRGRFSPDEVDGTDRDVEPAHEVVTLTDYRERFACYRRDPDLQAIHARHPFIAVWDDHDSADNSWAGGARNHDVSEGDWSARRAASQRAWLEWLPIRESVATDRGIIYRSFNFGNLARLIMLDARLVGRSRQLSYETDLKLPVDADDQAVTRAVESFRRDLLEAEDRTILGRDQEQWLATEMATSKANGQSWQLLGQQVIVGRLTHCRPATNGIGTDGPQAILSGEELLRSVVSRFSLPINLDAWDGYPAARRRLLEAITEKADRTIILSGDSHNAWAFALRDQSGLVAVEFAGTSVTSPGLEARFGADLPAIERCLTEVNPDLLWAEIEHRGFLTLTLTPAMARAEWWILDTVNKRGFAVRKAKSIVAHAASDRGIGRVE